MTTLLIVNLPGATDIDPLPSLVAARADKNLPLEAARQADEFLHRFLAREAIRPRSAGEVTIDAFAHELASHRYVFRSTYSLFTDLWRAESANGVQWRDILKVVITCSTSTLLVEFELREYLDALLSRSLDPLLPNQRYEVHSSLTCTATSDSRGATHLPGDEFARRVAGPHEGIIRFVQRHAIDLKPIYAHSTSKPKLLSPGLIRAADLDTAILKLYQELPPQVLDLISRLPKRRIQLSKADRRLLDELKKLGICQLDEATKKWTCFSPFFADYVRYKHHRKTNELVYCARVLLESSNRFVKTYWHFAPLYLLPPALVVAAFVNFANFLWLMYITFGLMALLSINILIPNKVHREQKDKIQYGIFAFVVVLLMGQPLHQYQNEKKSSTAYYDQFTISVKHHNWISPGDSHQPLTVKVSCTWDSLNTQCRTIPDEIKTPTFTAPLELVLPEKNEEKNTDGGTAIDEHEFMWDNEKANNIAECPDLNFNAPSTAQIIVGSAESPILVSNIDLFPQNIPVVGSCLASSLWFSNLYDSGRWLYIGMIVAILLEVMGGEYVLRKMTHSVNK